MCRYANYLIWNWKVNFDAYDFINLKPKVKVRVFSPDINCEVSYKRVLSTDIEIRNRLFESTHSGKVNM